LYVASKIHTSLTHDIAYQGHHTFALTNIFLNGTGKKHNRGGIIHITEKLLTEYAESPPRASLSAPFPRGNTHIFVLLCKRRPAWLAASASVCML
jgi:hypothetical protein